MACTGGYGSAALGNAAPLFTLLCSPSMMTDEPHLRNVLFLLTDTENYRGFPEQRENEKGAK